MPKHEEAPVLMPRQARRVVNQAEAGQRRHFRPRPHDGDDVTTLGKRLESMPGPEGVQAITAYDPGDGIAVAKRFDGIDGIRRAVAPKFDIGSRQQRVPGNGETQHLPSVRRVRASVAMGRLGGQDEGDRRYLQGAPHGAGSVEVAHMHRIESTAKKCPHLQ